MSWEIYQPTEYPAWQKVVQEFEAAHPNIGQVDGLAVLDL